MQRLLTPSEFDVLAARLFGSIANADAAYLPYAVPLAAVAGVPSPRVLPRVKRPAV